MQIMADFFESQGINYRVVGSLASRVYGEPRFTNDVDIVAELRLENLPALCAAFPSPDYYLSEPAARDAITKRFQFNILHPSSGLKVDIIVPPDTEFSRSEAGRIRRIASEGEKSAWFGSPEDVLLYKLVYYRLSGGISDKHLRDREPLIERSFVFHGGSFGSGSPGAISKCECTSINWSRWNTCWSIMVNKVAATFTN